MKNIALDSIDHKILNELRKNAKTTLSDIAERVGLSTTPCQQRIKRMEKNGVITGYKTCVNHHMLGESHIVFIQVKLSDTRTRALTAFKEAIMNTPEIEQCHMMAANYDYLLKIRTHNMGNFRVLLGETISALPYVQQTSSFVAMENIKD